MKLIGYILLGIGALVTFVSFTTDTAPEGTHNIGLMQGQMMLFQSGALLITVGALFAVTSIVLARLEAAGILPPSGFKAPTSQTDAKE